MSKSVLIYGGCGALGRACVTHFVSKGWNTISADIHENSEASSNVIVPSFRFATTNTELDDFFSAMPELHCILNVAGGWQGGSAASKHLVRNVDLSYTQSVVSSTYCTEIAARKLLGGGLLLLPGAAAALQPTPKMLGYGMGKAAVHHLVRSLAEPESCGLRVNCCTIGLLPITLDTAQNRASMPNADFNEWTPLNEVAWVVQQWAADPETRPQSGSLAVFRTREGRTRVAYEQ